MNCRKRRQAIRYRQEETVLKMEPMSRIELLTYALRKRCSTTELHRHLRDERGDLTETSEWRNRKSKDLNSLIAAMRLSR